jgi:hypothetical protein
LNWAELRQESRGLSFSKIFCDIPIAAMKLIYWLTLCLLLGSCIDKYVVNVNSPATGYLVVEGFINTSGSTNILISRTSGLDSPKYIPEPGANVQIQSQNGFSIGLTENPAGQYSVSGQSLDPSQQYRLDIKTAGGKEYQSDFSAVNITPPIDTVNWTANSNGVTISVSTHNNLVQPGYYQWQFEETWKYTSAYNSSIEYNAQDSDLENRPDSNRFFTCYRSDLSTVIDIANTEKLSSNVIYQFPLTQILYNNSDKLAVRYSILVRQYSLTSDWYQWVEKVQRNTEELGSIFDAQPSQTGGNLHCLTNPSEVVIGYIGTTSETDFRIFIDRSQLPPVLVFNSYAACEQDTIQYDRSVIISSFSRGNYIPLSLVYEQGQLSGVAYSDAQCVDCRYNNGTTVPPTFWY